MKLRLEYIDGEIKTTNMEIGKNYAKMITIQEDCSIVRKGVGKAINGIKSELEILTKNLDGTLSSIEASKMPEYDEAIDAIVKYDTAIQNKMKLLEQNKK